jgi:hypothetical protein
MMNDGYYRAPYPWWKNGLGWCMFVLGPGCGLALGIAIGEVLWS